jgi:hypothetical protein
MPPYNRGLEVVQWAREAVAGTDLAATSKLLVVSFNPTPGISEFYRPPVARGLIQRNRGFETVVKRGTQWSLEGPFSYEQGQHHLAGAIVNVAAPTGAGPYVWEHIRNPAAIPTLATFTFERQNTDGATPINEAWHYGLYQSLRLSFEDGQPLMIAAAGVARAKQSEAQTAALTLPTPEIPPAPLAKLFIDTSWAGLGGTQVSLQVLSADITINSGAVPIWTGDGRADLDFSLHNINAGNVSIEAEIVCLVGAQYVTEEAAARAGTLRAVRLQFDGTSSRQLQLDFLAKHERPDLFQLEEQDGMRIVRFRLQESTDGTNLLRAKLTNNVATFV